MNSRTNTSIDEFRYYLNVFYDGKLLYYYFDLDFIIHLLLLRSLTTSSKLKNIFTFPLSSGKNLGDTYSVVCGNSSVSTVSDYRLYDRGSMPDRDNGFFL
jgi:hypothetical protein